MTSSKVGRNFQKLIIKFTNAPVLDEVLFLQKTLIESITKMQKSILESSKAVMRWGQTETNFTFSDVLSNWFDLDNALWLLLQDLQNECIKYRQVYKGIKEEERIMCELGRKKEAKANEVNRLRSKVSALKKAGTKKAERLDTTEAELLLAEQEVRRLDDELSTFADEFEKSKARMIKDALEDYSKGWMTFARTSLDVFSAQSQMAQEMPRKPVRFEDQVTDANQMLVANMFKKLNLQKPDREIKPERETKVEAISPQSRRPTIEITQTQPPTDDQPKHRIFSSLGNNIGAKLSKLSHKTSKECLTEEPENNFRKSSLARPLPDVPQNVMENEPVDDEPNEFYTEDEYSILNDSNVDDEDYVVPNVASSYEGGRPQYTFLVKDMDQPRFPPDISQRMDQPRFPPDISHRMDQPRFPPDISQRSASIVTEEEYVDDDDAYLPVMSDVEEDVKDNDMIYEDVHPAEPPPRPPKNIVPETQGLSVPETYTGSNVFVLPPAPTLSVLRTSPNMGRKQTSSDYAVSPDLPEPQKAYPKPKVSPRPKRAPPALPPKGVSS